MKIQASEFTFAEQLQLFAWEEHINSDLSI